MSQPIILVQNVTKKYKNAKHSARSSSKNSYIYALTNFNMEVKIPSIIAVVGPKYSGKSTLFKLLLGLVPPSSGQIQILGYTPHLRQTEFLSIIGFANGQKISADSTLTVQDSLLLTGYLYNIDLTLTKERILELTKHFQFNKLAKLPLNQLSSVEKIKFEIMSALVHKPKILIIDEILSDLNNNSLQEIKKIIKQLAYSEQINIVILSEKLDSISDLCSEIINLESKEIP